MGNASTAPHHLRRCSMLAQSTSIINNCRCLFRRLPVSLVQVVKSADLLALVRGLAPPWVLKKNWRRTYPRFESQGVAVFPFGAEGPRPRGRRILPPGRSSVALVMGGRP